MGMFNANQSRAPHATLLFISSKIKATNNNTLAYLSSHPESETLVRKAVTVGAKLTLHSKVCGRIAEFLSYVV